MEERTDATIIEKHRVRMGISRYFFAEHVGVAVGTVKNWETGRSRVPEAVIRLLDNEEVHQKAIRSLREIARNCLKVCAATPEKMDEQIKLLDDSADAMLRS